MVVGYHMHYTNASPFQTHLRSAGGLPRIKQMHPSQASYLHYELI